MGRATHIPASQAFHASDEPSITVEEEVEGLPLLDYEFRQELDRDEIRYQGVYRWHAGRSNKLKELASFGLKWRLMGILLFVCCSTMAIFTTPLAWVLLQISWATKMTKAFYEVT